MSTANLRAVPDPQLPPLTALRAFAAAGRLQSVREAAAELNVTGSAVSHHIRTVEEWAGVALFVRGPRQIRLTPAGRALSERLNAAFVDMAAALAATRTAQSRVLRISALPLFTSIWLIPRLGHFEAANPGISIDIETTNRMVDLDTDPVDIAIRNVDAPTPGFECHKLMDLRAVPLCTPAIAAHVRCAADLANETLIHVSARRDSWPRWLAYLGFADLQARAHLSFDTVPAALDAASHGRGVMLGPGPLVLQAPQARELVIPFETALFSAGAYFLIHRRRDRADARVRSLVTWIKRELRAPSPERC